MCVCVSGVSGLIHKTWRNAQIAICITSLNVRFVLFILSALTIYITSKENVCVKMRVVFLYDD